MESFHEVEPQPGKISVEVISHSGLRNAHLSCAKSEAYQGIIWNWRSGGSVEQLFSDMRNLTRKKKFVNNRSCFVMLIFQKSLAQGLTLKGIKLIIERAEQFIKNYHQIFWVSKIF